MASVERTEHGWAVRWREGGRGSKRHQRTVSSERAAHILAAEIEEAIERHGRYEPRRTGRASALGTVLTEYMAELARRCRPNTVRGYAQHLELFREWAGDVLVDEAFSYHKLSAYHTHLSNPQTGRHLHRRGPETIRKHIQVIEQAWAWAWKRQARGTYHGVPQPDSLELKRQPAPRKLAPSWADMDAAIGCADGWQHDLYLVLRCTGLRVGQALGLRWNDLRLDREVPTLHVRPELGKTEQERRGRWVPLAPVLVEHLAGMGRREGNLLPCNRKQRVARARDAQRAWTRAGVDPALWSGCAHHAFRAGFNSGLVLLGANESAVEYLIGHSIGDVRERYTDPEALALVDAVQRVPRLGETEQVVRRFSREADR